MRATSASHQSGKTHNIAIYLVLLTTAVLWGSAFVVSKVIEDAVLPPVAAFLRFGVGAMFGFGLLFVFRARNHSFRLLPQGYIPSIVFLGLIGVTAYNISFFWGLSFSKASDGSMIIPTLSPAFTVLFSVLFFKEKVRRKHVIGLCLTLIGSAVFFSTIAFVGVAKPNRLIGDGLFLIAAFSWALYTLRGKKVLIQVDPLLVTVYAMLFGSIVLGLFAIPDFGKTNWESLNLNFWLDIVYLAVFPSVLANWFYYLGVKNIGPSRASVFMYFVPVSGLILSSVLLGEVLTFFQFIGSAVMVMGVWVMNRQGRTPRKIIQGHSVHKV